MQSMSLHAVMFDSSVHLQLCLDIKDFHGSGAAVRPGFRWSPGAVARGQDPIPDTQR